MKTTGTTTSCCDTPTYVDHQNGCTYCVICDSMVNPINGRVLTEREQALMLDTQDPS